METLQLIYNQQHKQILGRNRITLYSCGGRNKIELCCLKQRLL